MAQTLNQEDSAVQCMWDLFQPPQHAATPQQEGWKNTRVTCVDDRKARKQCNLCITPSNTPHPNTKRAQPMGFIYDTNRTRMLNIKFKLANFSAPSADLFGGRRLDCFTNQPQSLLNLFHLLNTIFRFSKVTSFDAMHNWKGELALMPRLMPQVVQHSAKLQACVQVQFFCAQS
eukprot:1156069-Pelagomonas_calceolata.AAC.6